jgi:hypothetical protein
LHIRRLERELSKQNTFLQLTKNKDTKIEIKKGIGE